jgi:hypothetical protein
MFEDTGEEETQFQGFNVFLVVGLELFFDFPQ